MISPKKILVSAALSAAMLFSAQGCSFTQLTIGATSGIIDGGFKALNRETDLQIAAQAIPADLKLLDGLIIEAPDNEKLLLLGAQGYTSYALGFVQDSSRERANLFYLRARDYGLRILFENSDFKEHFNGGLTPVVSFWRIASKFSSISGIAIYSAPPAIPTSRAMKPASRPITST